MFSHVQLFATPWTVALQDPLSMGFSRQEYWSGLPCPSPEDLPDPGVKPRYPALQTDSLPSTTTLYKRGNRCRKVRWLINFKKSRSNPAKARSWTGCPPCKYFLMPALGVPRGGGLLLLEQKEDHISQDAHCASQVCWMTFAYCFLVPGLLRIIQPPSPY